MLPYLSAQPPAFVFLTHLRDDDDLYRIGASSFLRRYSDGEDDFRRKMSSLPPLVAGEISFGFRPSGARSSSSCASRTHSSAPAGAAPVLEGLEVALARGAWVIGLGSTDRPGDGRAWPSRRHLPDGVTLTNTNAYTAVLVQANVLEAAADPGIGHGGAGGGDRLHRFGRCAGQPAAWPRTGSRSCSWAGQPSGVRRHLGDLEGKVQFAAGLDSALGSDVVVLLTAATSRPV